MEHGRQSMNNSGHLSMSQFWHLIKFPNMYNLWHADKYYSTFGCGSSLNIIAAHKDLWKQIASQFVFHGHRRSKNKRSCVLFVMFSQMRARGRKKNLDPDLELWNNIYAGVKVTLIDVVWLDGRFDVARRKKIDICPFTRSKLILLNPPTFAG